jgi:hypothetical protein
MASTQNELIKRAMADIYAPVNNRAGVPAATDSATVAVEPPIWVEPEHTEIDLATVTAEELNLDPMNPADDSLAAAIDAAHAKAQLKKKVLVAPVIPQPDANGEFATPADGAKFMAGTYGIPQIPLNGKKPFFDRWQDKTTTDFTQIDAWHAKYKGNFGSVAKSQPNGHFVLEVDSTNVIARAKQDGVSFSSQVIIQSRIGRGHRWYIHSDESRLVGNIQQADTAKADFSVRADDMQCVSPGSINPVSGEQYRVKLAGTIAVASSAELNWLKSQKVSVSTGKKEITKNAAGLVPHGSVHSFMLSLAGKLRRAGATSEEIEPILLRKVHEECQSPHDDTKIRAMAQSIGNFPEGSPVNEMVLFDAEVPKTLVVDEKRMPDPLSPDAYHGIVGRHLRNIENNSEAHPAGILTLFLSGFGSMVGMAAYFRVEDNLHYPMVNVIITGQSSRSRKDTAMGRALRPLKATDPIWGKEHIRQGFSSGEAVVSYFDRLYRKGLAGPQMFRLFVTDTEFKSTLTICGREGNTLSEVYRHMFNGDSLEVNVKKTKECLSVPYSCGTSAGLITKSELLDVLKDSEMASGFVNRYLTVLVHRVRKISRPARITDPVALLERDSIVDYLKTVMQWVSQRKLEKDAVDGTIGIKIVWGEEAGKAWDTFYYSLGDDDQEYLTRAEVFVLRISMIYALLDMSDVIEPAHLKAALAVWRYAEQSSHLVYGNPQPSNVVKLMNRVLTAGYVKRGAVHSLFQRHMPADGLDWIMEEAAKVSNGRLEVDYGLFKGERIVAAIHHVGKN